MYLFFSMYTFYLHIETIISEAGKPKAMGKHVSRPKHWTLFLSSGVMAVEIREPALIEK